jgi:hypothetical protein
MALIVLTMSQIHFFYVLFVYPTPLNIKQQHFYLTLETFQFKLCFDWSVYAIFIYNAFLLSISYEFFALQLIYSITPIHTPDSFFLTIYYPILIFYSNQTIF